MICYIILLIKISAKANTSFHSSINLRISTKSKFVRTIRRKRKQKKKKLIYLDRTQFEFGPQRCQFLIGSPKKCSAIKKVQMFVQEIPFFVNQITTTKQAFTSRF